MKLEQRSNHIFIPHLTAGFNGLGKDNFKDSLLSIVRDNNSYYPRFNDKIHKFSQV